MLTRGIHAWPGVELQGFAAFLQVDLQQCCWSGGKAGQGDRIVDRQRLCQRRHQMLRIAAKKSSARPRKPPISSAVVVIPAISLLLVESPTDAPSLALNRFKEILLETCHAALGNIGHG